MDRIQSYILALQRLNMEIALIDYGINLLLTAFVAFVLAKVYEHYGSSHSNRKAFAKNFVLLALTTMIVISVIKSSLALSLGLVGALSIVRFRAAIKEPEELAFLFMSVAIGVGLGANQRMVTISGVCFIMIIICILFHKKKYIKMKEGDSYLLTIINNGEKGFQLDSLTSILSKFCMSFQLQRFDRNATNSEVLFIVTFEKISLYNELEKEIVRLFPRTQLSLLSNHVPY